MPRVEHKIRTIADAPAIRREALERKTGAWVPKTIAQALDDATISYRDRPLVMTDERIWSYHDIRVASQTLAARLMAHGVRPRDHVGLWMANHVEFVIAKFAIARIGAVAVPINFMLRQTELAYVLGQSDCVALVTMDSFRGHDHLSDLDVIMPGWQEKGGGEALPLLRNVFVRMSEPSRRPNVKPIIDPGWQPTDEQIAAVEAANAAADPHFRCNVLYTSGTTGHPKGAMLSHDMVLRTAYGSTYSMAREDERRLLFSLPMYHVFGYVECLIASLFVGGAVVPRTNFDATDMIEAAERFEVGEIACVPLITREMLEVARKRGFDCPSLIAFFNSGGVNTPMIWSEIREVFGARELLTGYGMTETTASTCCCLPEGEDHHLITSNGRLKRAGVAGFPEYDGGLVAYKTVDPVTGADLPFGRKGELLVRGYCVTQGYYKKEEENNNVFTADGWMHTGDVGTIDPDYYVCLLGRIKETYRCGGEMVMPEEVENFIKAHENVENAFVVGVPDDKMGEVGCLLVIPRGVLPGVETIRDFCRDRIARFRIPKYVIEMKPEDIPMTATGRARRVQLASIARARLGL